MKTEFSNYIMNVKFIIKSYLRTKFWNEIKKILYWKRLLLLYYSYDVGFWGFDVVVVVVDVVDNDDNLD